MYDFIDLSILKDTNKKHVIDFKDFNIDTSHYEMNSPRIIKTIKIDF